MWQLAKDTLAVEDLNSLADWLRGQPPLTQGPQVLAFERAWAAWNGTSDAVMVASGTAANFALMASAARRVKRRPVQVGMAAVTWSTNVSPSLLLGHQVSLFDVDRQTLGIDTAQVCAAMRQGQLDILFVTHLLGFNALNPEILQVAQEHGVIVLEDCCEAHGARMETKRVGSIGLGGTFSFYFGHHMSTIEGGMVTTDDPDLADDLRLMRTHGLARASGKAAEYASKHPDIDPRFLFVQAGLNFRSTDLNAFLGQRQLRQLDARIAQRNTNLQHFLAHAPAFLWRSYRSAGVSSFALPLITETAEQFAAVQRCVTELGIESRPVVAGNLLRQPMMEGYNVKTPPGGTPVAEAIHQRGMYVGNGHHVTTAMIDKLLEALHRLPAAGQASHRAKAPQSATASGLVL